MPTRLESKLAAGANFGTTILKDSLANARPLEQRLGSLQSRFETSVSNTGSARNRLRAATESNVQQKFAAVGGGNRFAGNLEQTLRRAKARQQITGRGDAAISNQQLKDRVAIARQKIGRKGVLEGALGNAARLREGSAAATQRANDSIKQAQAGAFGAVAGGVVRGFGDNLFNTRASVEDSRVGEFAGAGDAFSGFDFSIDPLSEGSNGGTVFA